MGLSSFRTIQNKPTRAAFFEALNIMIADYSASREAAFLAANGGVLDPEAKQRIEPAITPEDMKKMGAMLAMGQHPEWGGDVMLILDAAFPGLLGAQSDLVVN